MGSSKQILTAIRSKLEEFVNQDDRIYCALLVNDSGYCIESAIKSGGLDEYLPAAISAIVGLAHEMSKDIKFGDAKRLGSFEMMLFQFSYVNFIALSKMFSGRMYILAVFADKSMPLGMLRALALHLLDEVGKLLDMYVKSLEEEMPSALRSLAPSPESVREYIRSEFK